MKPQPYLSSMEALEDTMELVKVWLNRHLTLYAHRFDKPNDGYENLYVARGEVDRFLSGADDADVAQRLMDLESQETALRAVLAQRADLTVTEGNRIPLEEFRAAFGITDEVVFDSIIVLVAGELFPQFMRAFTFAWADFTKRYIDIGFLLECCAQTAEEREQLLNFFLRRTHPLFLLGCIQLFDPPGTEGRPLIQTGVRLAPRVVQFLGGETEPTTTILGLRGHLWVSGRLSGSVYVPETTHNQCLRALRDAVGNTGPRQIFLVGPDGSGRRSLAHLGVTQLGRPLLVIDLSEWTDDTPRLYPRLLAVLREAALHNAIPMFANADELDMDRPGAPEKKAEMLAAMETIVSITPGPLLFSTRRPIRSAFARFGGNVEILVPHPDNDTQIQCWNRFLPPGSRLADGLKVTDIVARYSLTGGMIERVAAHAGSRTQDKQGTTADVLYGWIRDELCQRLGSLANAVFTGHVWDDLVVPTATKEALEELINFVRHRRKITTEWGIGAKTERGRGVAALFYGPPGTGKTMAAGLVGTALGLEVFQIDLSQIVDKYIGETEKNLARMFDEGARAQAVLLFDEADSLFGKRTGVSSATDRYANLEINYLLQRLEKYDGISILTSNFPELIDDAFKRRIRFKVEFPFPSKEERQQLWNSMLPPTVPRAQDVSLAKLAAEYELSGAHIQNITLRAAAMAAGEQQELTMTILRRAANRECAELGKIVQEYVG